MLKNGLICLISLCILVSFVITRTQKKVIPVNQLPALNQLLTVSLDKQLIKIIIFIPDSIKNPKIRPLMDKALSLAQNDLNQKDVKYRYQLMVEPLPIQSNSAPQSVRRHFTQEKADAFIKFDLQTNISHNPLSNKENILHVPMLISYVEANEDTFPLSIALTGKNTLRIMKLLHKKGCRRVAFIGMESLKTKTFEKKLLEAAVEQKMVIKNQWIKKDLHEIGVAIQKAQDFHPDGYIILLDTAGQGEFMKQLAKTKSCMPVVHIGPITILNQKNLCENVYFVDLQYPHESFVKRVHDYLKTTTYTNGRLVDETVMAAVYDSVMLTVKLFEKATDKENAGNQVHQIDGYVGVGGVYIKDENGQFMPQPAIKKIINAKAYILDE